MRRRSSQTSDTRHFRATWSRRSSQRSRRSSNHLPQGRRVIAATTRGDPPFNSPSRRPMSVTDTNATERVESEPPAAQDPSVSPVVDHSPVTLHSPVPRVTRHAPAPSTDGQVDRAPRGVKLAKISKTGDRVFRALARTTGLVIVLIVLFVGIFLSALALPSLQANQDNFLAS